MIPKFIPVFNLLIVYFYNKKPVANKDDQVSPRYFAARERQNTIFESLNKKNTLVD